MHAVVPAAGQGTRMAGAADDRPKPLVRIGDETILGRLLRQLASLDPAGCTLVVRDADGPIRTRFGPTHAGLPLRYAVQSEPQGLADAVVQAAPVTDPLLVVNGDNVFERPPEAVVAAHARAEATATLLVESVDREMARTTGVCEFDAAGHLIDLVEKPANPPSCVALAGCVASEPVLFEACRAIPPSERDEYELTDALAHLLATGHDLRTVRSDGWRTNVNTPADRDHVVDRLASTEDGA
jgi:dTDP-glucose pyrophosphorylase